MHPIKEVPTMRQVDELILIGGDKQDCGGRIPVMNPARSSEIVGSVPRCSADDAARAIEAAANAFPTWSRRPISERAALLASASRAVVDGAEDRATLLTRESGKLLREARGEIASASRTLEYYADLAATVVLAEDLASGNGRVVVARRPMGVTAIIVPWNAPVHLSTLAVAPALLAGNTVVVKPATEAPLAVIDFLRRVSDCLPDGVINIVTGSGEEVGETLIAHPLVRRVMFTGSTEVGKRVAAQATAEMKRVTVELGGNDPAIVMPDADLDSDLVPEIMRGVYGSSGQVCYAIKRIYVHSSLYHEFVRRFTAASAELAVGDGLDPRADIGPLINRDQVNAIARLIEDARIGGATVNSVGRRLDPATWSDGCFHLPTVVTDVDHTFSVVSSEQFGPVIPIMPFASVDEAVAFANDTAYGLASSIWTRDVDDAWKLAERMESGTTFVNIHRQGASGPDMPFGGWKSSGLGRSHGMIAVQEQFELQTLSTRRPDGH